MSKAKDGNEASANLENSAVSPDYRPFDQWIKAELATPLFIGNNMNFSVVIKVSKKINAAARMLVSLDGELYRRAQ